MKLPRRPAFHYQKLVREFLNAQIHARTYDEMRLAAEKLSEDYANNEDLVDMTALDGEDFING